jgi:hypothetical protein
MRPTCEAARDWSYAHGYERVEVITGEVKLQRRRMSSNIRRHRTLASVSASFIPFGCRPSRIASTMSGARQVSGSSRQM